MQQAPFPHQASERYSNKGEHNQQGIISSSTLLLLAFASAFFPRILEAAGAPSQVNFAHFIVLPAACGVVLLSSRSCNRHQLAIVKSLIVGLMVLLTIATASALLNSAGVVNVFLEFILLSEPFVLLTALLSIPFSENVLYRLRKWIIGFGAIHIALALAQKIGLEAGLLKHSAMTLEDNIQGVFYLSSGGHVVGASVSLAFGVYYYVSAKLVPFWLRASVSLAVMIQILIADAKQVIAVAIAAWILLIISKVADIKATLQYVIAAVLSVCTLYWCIYNVELFDAYRAWIRPEIYGLNGAVMMLKTSPLRIITAHYTSLLHWLLGLGPGHTVGRIGGWMIRDYWSLFGPLGATSSPVSEEVWATWRGSYLDSSFFSPFWGWAGIWGDLGLLGLASYLSLWRIVWAEIRRDDMSCFLMFNVIVSGFVFTLMEEPGFMLTSVVLVGLRWYELLQEKSCKQRRLIEHSLC